MDYPDKLVINSLTNVIMELLEPCCEAAISLWNMYDKALFKQNRGGPAITGAANWVNSKNHL